MFSSSHAFIFYSYASEDKKLHERLNKHLSILWRIRNVITWSSQEIGPGKERLAEMRTAMENAHIILLLISSDFLASDYCYSIEMQQALQRHDMHKVRVVPIILRPVVWEYTPIGKLQPLPQNGKPVVSWKNRDNAFVHIVMEIKKILDDEVFPSLAHADPAAISFPAVPPDDWDTEDILEAMSPPDDLFPISPPDSHSLHDTYYVERYHFDRQIAHILLDEMDLPMVAKEFPITFAYYSSVITFYRKNIRERKPLNSYDYSCIGDVLKELGVYQGALYAYDRAISLSYRYEDELSRAQVFYWQGQYEKARALYENILQQITHDPYIYQSLGIVLQLLKRKKEAKRAFQQAHHLYPLIRERYEDDEHALTKSRGGWMKFLHQT